MLLKAFDETFSTIVQTRTSYTSDDVVWGARFANAFMADAAERFALMIRARTKEGRDRYAAFRYYRAGCRSINSLNIPRRSRTISLTLRPLFNQHSVSRGSCFSFSAGNLCLPAPTHKWRNYG